MANALTGNFSPLAAIGYVQDQGELGRQRGQQNRLSMLSSQAYSATTPQEQSSLLGQIAQISPQAAQAQQQQFQSQEDRNRKELYGLAQGWKKIPSQYRQNYYDRFLSPRLSAMGMGEQPAYDEASIDGAADQIIAAFGGGGAENPYSKLPADVQTLRLLQDNPALAQLDRERRQASGMVPKLVQTQEGYGWGTPGAGISLAPMTGPASQGGGFGIAETDNYVRNILSKVQVDPNASPEQQAAQLLPALIQQESGGNPYAVSKKGATGLTQVMPATGTNPGFGVSPLQNGSPEENVRFGRDYLTAMLRRYPGRPDLALAAYNAGPAVADRFAGSTASNGGGIAQPYRAPAAAPAGYRATPDGNLQAIPGGPADKPEAAPKPIPASVLRMRQESREALSVAQGMGSELANIRQQLESGKLQLGPMNNYIYQARNAAGQSTDESRAYQNMRSSFEKLRNDSLRLNKGVQTEGDAERAWNELLGNLNDNRNVIQQLQRIERINDRAIQLHTENMDDIEAEYGAKNAPGRGAVPSAGSVEDGYRFKGGDPSNPSSWERI